MGMTNGQFKSYVKLLIKLIDEAKNETEREEMTKKLESLLSILQAALED